MQAKCKWCGRAFECRNKKAKYCSGRCRTAFYRAKGEGRYRMWGSKFTAVGGRTVRHAAALARAFLTFAGESDLRGEPHVASDWLKGNIRRRNVG